MAILHVSELTKRFGGLTAVDSVSMEVREGEIIGLIGPNGAGKTTFVNLLTGILPSSEGTIQFDGRDITRLKPHARCREGISRTFQIPQPFVGMTVEDNVATAVLFGHEPGCTTVGNARRRAQNFLESVGLGGMEGAPVGELTTAGLKRLELARCLAGNAKLMLLDEPLSGLNHSELKSTLSLIQEIRDTGKTIIFIEHIMPAVMSVSDRVVVLANGAKLAEGTPNDIQKNPNVQRAYLGDVDGTVGRYAAARRAPA
ncbi:ABC transporter ATP-binding protein [Limibacillus halophilus]|uniref:Branched-chain amino acid transport system ATP-binding protein n=1 Tax=Limibacillus halophilus TaxID=1579333 RepID=A0A839SZE7_9PROT|nr:ABC transporter ATP-binding protein [Limibacillus halophilus]MBB3066996.1 branched-chain amino acid transport system ATP-binding protein [Limibacillus halophilus]